MSLKIQIVSDLHLEFWPEKKRYNFIKSGAPILALLGDICCCSTDGDFDLFRRFIFEILPKYEHIIYVPGNHEYYTQYLDEPNPQISYAKRTTSDASNSKSSNTTKKAPVVTRQNTIDAINQKIKQFFSEYPTLHYLNNETLDIKSGRRTYTIIGSTLWSNIPVNYQETIQYEMSDYSMIYTIRQSKTREIIARITPAETTALHHKNVAYIKRQITRAKEKGNSVIVFTHHRPYLTKTYNPQSDNVAYMSDLSSMIQSPVVLWAFGHMHEHVDEMYNSVRMYSNCKGYPHERCNFDKSKVITV